MVTAVPPPSNTNKPRFIVDDVLQIKRKQAYIKFIDYIRTNSIPLIFSLSFLVKADNNNFNLRAMLKKNGIQTKYNTQTAKMALKISKI